MSLQGKMMFEFSMSKLIFILILGGIVLVRFIKDAQRDLNVSVFIAVLVACLQLLLLLFVFVSVNFALGTIIPPALLDNNLFSWFLFGMVFIIGTYVLKKVNFHLKTVLTTKINSGK
jgi:hypothetical protein